MSSSSTYKILRSSDEEKYAGAYIHFSEYAEYSTQRITDEGTQSGEAAWIDVIEGKSFVPSAESDLWENAVQEYIDKYNDNIEYLSIKYNILDKDGDARYHYEKYVNENIVEDKWGLYPDNMTKNERRAWEDAVHTYMSKNGMWTMFEDLQKSMDDIREKIKADSAPKVEYELIKNPLPPMVETAIPTLATNPCDFIENIQRAIEVAVTRINGIPSPADIYAWVLKATKHDAKAAIENASECASGLLAEPVFSTINETEAYFRDLDAYNEGFQKRYADMIAEYENAMREAGDYPFVIEIKYEDGDGDYTEEYLEEYVQRAEEGTEPGNVDTIVVDFDAAKYITYDDVAMPSKRTTSKVDSYAFGLRKGDTVTNSGAPAVAKERINEAIRSLFAPLKAAWMEYCEKKGGSWAASGWTITSGYRAPKYNAAVKGSATSAHAQGFAIDVVPKNGKITELCDFVYSFCKASGGKYRFDQLLNESNGQGSHWMHLGYKKADANGKTSQRGQYAYEFNAATNSSGGKNKYL